MAPAFMKLSCEYKTLNVIQSFSFNLSANFLFFTFHRKPVQKPVQKQAF